MKYEIRKYDEMKNVGKSIKDINTELEVLIDQKEYIRTCIEKLNRRKKNLELLISDLGEATKQEVDVVCYVGSLEVHFKQKPLKKQEVEKQAGKVIREWGKLYELITQGIMVYWKHDILIFRFPMDEKEITHFENTLKESESNIIF